MAADRARARRIRARSFSEDEGFGNCAVVQQIPREQAGIEFHWWANRFTDLEPHHRATHPAHRVRDSMAV
ncbi:hypothetical protein I546_6764 [Mycobacterium kansasii 732]|nr:hypothetical protein I546_6764 [Mycobacterium kansasii 732]